MGERFAKDTADHAMTVALDEGLHRHLKFRAPDTGMYWFEIATWPGVMVIRGDMGTFVFSREPDMIGFFRGPHIDHGYWAEKEVTGAPTKRFDQQRAAQLVKEHIAEIVGEYEPHDVETIQRAASDLLAQMADAMGPEEAHSLLDGFRIRVADGSYVEFYDTWEWDLQTWTAQFLWCCEAIAWAIRQYDAKGSQ